MSSLPSLDEYDLYGLDCIGPHPTRDSSSVIDPLMEEYLRSLIARYFRAIADDDLELFWVWIMPQWEKRFPQCFTYPYQPEYKDSYRRWQMHLENWLDSYGGRDWEKFLHTASVKSTSPSATSQMADNKESSSLPSWHVENLVIDLASATSSDLELFGHVSVYSEVPRECVLKKNLSYLRSEVEKWLADVPPPQPMELQTWIKLITKDSEATSSAN